MVLINAKIRMKKITAFGASFSRKKMNSLFLCWNQLVFHELIHDFLKCTNVSWKADIFVHYLVT